MRHPPNTPASCDDVALEVGDVQESQSCPWGAAQDENSPPSKAGQRLRREREGMSLWECAMVCCDNEHTLEGRCEKIGSGEWLALPLTPGRSPRWGEGKVTLYLAPSPLSGERVAKGRVRGPLESIRNSFTASGRVREPVRQLNSLESRLEKGNPGVFRRRQQG
jgi:hypothetical protein